MGHRRPLISLLSVSLAAAGAALVGSPPVGAEPAAEAVAPGAPGALSHFDLARKDCVGTARNGTSKVWFTVANGVLSDVYAPTIDNTNVETLQYVGHRRVDVHRPADPRHDVHGVGDSTRPGCPAGSPAPRAAAATAGHRLPHRPARDAVVMQTRLRGRPARSSSTSATTPRSTATAAAARPTAAPTTPPSTRPPPRWSARTPNTVTNAVNRDYARAAVRRAARRPAVPGRDQRLRRHRRPTGWPSSTPTTRSARPRPDAPDGNVVQTAQLDRRGDAPVHAGARLRADRRDRDRHRRRLGPGVVRAAPCARYAAGWVAYDARLKPPAAAAGRAVAPRRPCRLAQRTTCRSTC